MNTHLISKELVSLEYRERLQQDLSRATVCRFLVAYVSKKGLHSIGTHLLLNALRDPRSFGVASLTCACGHEPLLELQRELQHSFGETVGVRLKYFMDPVVEGADEPSDIALFHSNDLDAPPEGVGRGRTATRSGKSAPSLERVQRVYTSPLADLATVWAEAAERFRAKHAADPRSSNDPPDKERPDDEPR